MTLAAEALTLALKGRTIVSALDLAIAPGGLIGVLGPNGAGKSTLLKGLAGLLPPSAGRVTLDGADLEAVPPRERARTIAYMPQERAVYWPLAVERVVALGRLPHAGGGTADDAAAISAAIEAADIGHLGGRSVATLSGGELARVLLARALAQTPRVLLADEPTAGLDPAHQLALFERFQALAATGVAVVVALHDLSQAMRYCTRVLLLRDGESIGFGSPAAVLTPANLRAAYGIDARIAEVGGIPVVVPLARSAARGD
jgi:iron complex transport system ATP-binding protein